MPLLQKFNNAIVLLLTRRQAMATANQTMPRYSTETKAQAVARIRAGDATAHQVAQDLGASHSTVAEWIKKADQPATTDDEKTFAASIENIQQRIAAKQDEVRDALLARIADLIPQTDDLRAVATAYGIVTDKQLLAEGKPTSITAQGVAIPNDASALELRQRADEMRQRMADQAARAEHSLSTKS